MNWLRIGMLAIIAAGGASAQLSLALELNNKGNAASDAANYKEAQRLYREALDIWRAAGPVYDAHLAGTLMNLGVALGGSGDRTQAGRVFTEALALHRRTLGARHHRTVSNINLLASNQLMLGDLDSADALLTEVLVVERELFPDDIQTARTLEGISNLMIRRGKVAAAMEPAEEALAIVLKAAGEESIDSALAYSAVAEAHRAVGHMDRAAPLFRKSRTYYERALGPDHPRTATLLSQEGLILMSDGKLAMAEQLMVRAVDTLGRSCPGCLAERTLAETNLGVLRVKQKRYREAGVLLAEVVAMREKFMSSPDADMADALRILAAIRQKEGLLDDAVRLNRQAAAITSFR
jgi:tetratricopeptide (TPR) repeat protein